MVVKKMKNKEPDKSVEYSIIDIIDYINDEQNIDPNKGKILYSGTYNMTAEQMTTDDIIAEMTELATKSKKCKYPITHALLSFSSDYEANIEQLKSIVKDFIDDIGYAGCQTNYAIHQNTDNIHIHIAINRIDPETFKARSDYNDVDKMHRAVAKIEAKYNIKSEPHSIYSEVDGELVKNQYIEPETEITIPDNARKMEIHQGEKSMIRITAEEILPILKDAKSWQELHNRLANQGFKYEKKGGGAILIAFHDNKETQIKPSDVARWASLKNMEKRLGTYQPSKMTDKIESRQPEPMPGIPQQVLDDFKADKEEYKNNNDAIYKEFEKQKDELKREQKAIIDAISEYKKTEKTANSVEAQSALEAYKIVVNEEMEKKHESLIIKCQAKLEENKKIMPPVTDFEAWLRFKNLEIDTSLNTNKVIIPNYDDTKYNHTIDEKIDFFNQYHNAVQADRYRITSVGKNENGMKVVFILDKDKDGISKGYTPEQIINNIPYMSSFEAKYEHLYFTPLSDNKHHFFIDDMDYNTVLKLKNNGIIPNCIIESSKGNYQSIFTLDKIGTDNDKAIINNIASSLNRLYGDINFCGAVHPHRVPGFWNVKPKHRQPDGSYFIARIIEAQPEQCGKLLDYMAFMDSYYTWKKNNIKSIHVKIIPISANNQHQISNNDYVKLFMLHYNEILKIRNTAVCDDPSRMDFMIATRLRATGHSQIEVANILYAGNIYIGRQNKYDLEQNANITAESVFTKMEADSKIYELRAWIPQWKRLENAVLTPNNIITQEQNYESKNQKLGVKSVIETFEKPEPNPRGGLHQLP